MAYVKKCVICGCEIRTYEPYQRVVPYRFKHVYPERYCDRKRKGERKMKEVKECVVYDPYKRLDCCKDCYHSNNCEVEEIEE